MMGRALILKSLLSTENEMMMKHESDFMEDIRKYIYLISRTS